VYWGQGDSLVSNREGGANQDRKKSLDQLPLPCVTLREGGSGGGRRPKSNNRTSLAEEAQGPGNAKRSDPTKKRNFCKWLARVDRDRTERQPGGGVVESTDNNGQKRGGKKGQKKTLERD